MSAMYLQLGTQMINSNPQLQKHPVQSMPPEVFWRTAVQFNKRVWSRCVEEIGNVFSANGARVLRRNGACHYAESIFCAV